MLWSPLLMLTTPNRTRKRAGLIKDEVLGRGWDQIKSSVVRMFPRESFQCGMHRVGLPREKYESVKDKKKEGKDRRW